MSLSNENNNLIIRKKIALKLKEKAQLDEHELVKKESNVIIRKKIQIKLKKQKDSDSNEVVKLTTKTDVAQLNKYLDDTFKHHLMMLKDSWSEVDYKIRMDNNNQECWWDLEFLVVHFAEQLNGSCMSNPSPHWPSNPFNRVAFTKQNIMTLHKQIKELKIPVNFMLNELFNYLQDKFRYVSIDKFTPNFIAYVNQKYRFKLVNSLDSQGNYIGYWVKKTDPLSLFEQRYKELQQISPTEYNEDTEEFEEREEYVFYKDILEAIPKENIDLSKTALIVS